MTAYRVGRLIGVVVGYSMVLSAALLFVASCLFLTVELLKTVLAP